MNAKPIEADEIQAFLEALDEASDKLRELLDSEAPGDSPAIQYYLDGSVFLECGYLMVEHLADRFPGVYRALYDDHFWPMFLKTRRGQIGWTEALQGLPEFVQEYASAKVHQDLFMGDNEA